MTDIEKTQNESVIPPAESISHSAAPAYCITDTACDLDTPLSAFVTPVTVAPPERVLAPPPELPVLLNVQPEVVRANKPIIRRQRSVFDIARKKIKR